MIDCKELEKKLREYDLCYNEMGKYMYQVWSENTGRKYAFYPSTETWISYDKKRKGKGFDSLINEIVY